MTGTSLFETTAEISVAFAGFIGVFLALAARENRLAGIEAVSVQTIVVGSIVPIFYSFLPLVLDYLGLTGPSLWRLASGVTATFSILITFGMMRPVLALPRPDRRPLRSPVSAVSAGSGATSMLLLLCNCLGWPWEPSGGVYLVAVWLVVIIAATHFVALIFRHVLPSSAA